MPSPFAKDTTTKGRIAEQTACRHLSRMGFSIVDRNVQTFAGELDIVAREGDTLVFIEVRSRADGRLGHPLETISPAKQRRLRAAATAYLTRCSTSSAPCRFDVIGITWDPFDLVHIRNAF